MTIEPPKEPSKGVSPTAPTQNPIPQQGQPVPSQQATVPPGSEKNKAKRSNTLWWVLGGCCAIVIIAMIALTVIGLSFFDEVKEAVQDLAQSAEEGDVNPQDVVKQLTSEGVSPLSSSEPAIVDAVMAESINTETGEPVSETDVYASSVVTYTLVVTVSNLDAQDVAVVWYQNNKEVERYTLEGIKGDNNLSFYLDVSQSTPEQRTGDYAAEVYLDNALTETIKFSVSN